MRGVLQQVTKCPCSQLCLTWFDMSTGPNSSMLPRRLQHKTTQNTNKDSSNESQKLVHTVSKEVWGGGMISVECSCCHAHVHWVAA